MRLDGFVPKNPVKNTACLVLYTAFGSFGVKIGQLKAIDQIQYIRSDLIVGPIHILLRKQATDAVLIDCIEARL